MPAIGRSLHASVTALQWTLTSYLLAVAALLLLSGALADHFGRRKVLAAGLLVMLVGSILCAAAPSISTLIAARVLQGIGGALVVPSSLALLNGTLRPGDRSRGIGIWAGLATLGTTVGPYAGGWLTDHVSWRALFLLNPPLILAGLIVLWFVPPADLGGRPLSLEIWGAMLAVGGLGGVIYALTAGPASGWLSGPVLAAAVIGIVGLAGLVPAERRRRAPMLRLSLFASRQFDAINVMTVLLYGALYAVGYMVILQCELRLGYSATQAGAALIPESAVFLAVTGQWHAGPSRRPALADGSRTADRGGGVRLAVRRASRPGLRGGGPARRPAVGPRDRHLRDPADRGGAGRGERRRPRRGLGDQRRDVAGGRGSRDRTGTRAHRGYRRAQHQPGAGSRIPARDARHGRAVCRGRVGHRAIRQRQPSGRACTGVIAAHP